MDVRRNWGSPVGKLRVIGALEAVSFLALLGLGMPLKYLWHDPILVRVLGPIHGLLFLWLCSECARAVQLKGWSAKKGLWVFLAALLPCGPFLIDGWLKKEQSEFNAL